MPGIDGTVFSDTENERRWQKTSALWRTTPLQAHLADRMCGPHRKTAGSGVIRKEKLSWLVIDRESRPVAKHTAVIFCQRHPIFLTPKHRAVNSWQRHVPMARTMCSARGRGWQEKTALCLATRNPGLSGRKSRPCVRRHAAGPRSSGLDDAPPSKPQAEGHAAIVPRI